MEGKIVNLSNNLTPGFPNGPVNVLSSSQNYSMHRADSFDMFIPSIDIPFKDELTLKVYFGVMEPNQPFECAIIRHTYLPEDFDSEGNLVIKLQPYETELLSEGLYYYEIKAYAENEFSEMVKTLRKAKLYIV